jgi:Family of unknown function (DUF6206)
MIDDSHLHELEATVSLALRTRDVRDLNLIGHGEITMALGWPAEEPQYVCKRLPPFDSGTDAATYASVVDRYVDILRDRGVRVVDTEVRWIERPDGRTIAFHIQPALAPETLGLEVLRRSTPAPDNPFLCSIVDIVTRGTGGGVGIDAQISNWSWAGGEPWQLDLSTPFWMNEADEPMFDMTPFLASLPAAMRPVVRSEMVKLIRRWLTPRGSLLDLAANVIKANLDDWTEPVLECINARVDEPITYKEAQRVYQSDRRTFPILLQLQRVNRFWQERLRQRPYDFLLPESTTYKVHAS